MEMMRHTNKIWDIASSKSSTKLLSDFKSAATPTGNGEGKGNDIEQPLLPRETIIKSLEQHQQLYGEKGMTINPHVDLEQVVEALGFRKKHFLQSRRET